MLRRSLLAGAVVLPGAIHFLSCQPAVPLLNKLFDGKSLEGWLSEGGKPQAWEVQEGILHNGPTGKVNNIYTAGTFGDMELWVEFRIPEKSNSGVYLHGLYEVQIFDSFGKESLATSDSGSIYHRWIDDQPVGGSVARQNASRAPGQWQEFHLRFRAPQFDTKGKKTRNARFEFVRYNGVLVHENVACEGPTRAHMQIPEAAKNPLMIQGDHGPVEFRRIDAIKI